MHAVCINHECMAPEPLHVPEGLSVERRAVHAPCAEEHPMLRDREGRVRAVIEMVPTTIETMARIRRLLSVV